ncbi:uncharacterized protein LOC112563172 [Pomacea canaliculata]|uniref:uncharacterized protein LOC112563172 n=1 Tax=Pomacea canaliculata TaxID=400727 RepID=UPI000D734323|nr:uncharacterized protein LOC112563172 [Pomacea canaliculata]
MSAQRIVRILKQFHLRPVKNMKFTFDPCSRNVLSIREVLFHMHLPKITSTNQNVAMKVDVKSDRSEPVMEVSFADGTKVIVKTAYLSTLEILDRLLEFCNAKDKSKDETPLPQTKAARKK